MYHLPIFIASIGLAMSGLPNWCDPHPPVPGAIIEPSGPIRDGESVVITCFMDASSTRNRRYTIIDWCVNGNYIPGITSCDQRINLRN